MTRSNEKTETGLDRSGFDKLVLDHLESAHRFATRLTGSCDSAEDLMHDALVKAIRHYKSFRGESRFSTWLMRIIINTHRDRLGNRRDEPLTDDTHPPDTAPGPHAAAAGGELAEKVAALVSSLPLRQREVLVLTAYEGVSISDAATMLGITEQNARTTLHYARQKLRERLAPYLSQAT